MAEEIEQVEIAFEEKMNEKDIEKQEVMDQMKK